MANFDPASRRETRIFKELFKDDRGRPVYQMMHYCYVEYDGSPDRYLEPLPVPRYGPDDKINQPTVTGLGQIVGIEYVTRRPSEVFALDDFDAANQ